MNIGRCITPVSLIPGVIQEHTAPVLTFTTFICVNLEL